MIDNQASDCKNDMIHKLDDLSSEMWTQRNTVQRDKAKDKANN